MRISLKTQFSLLVIFLMLGLVAVIAYTTLQHIKTSLTVERKLRGSTLIRNLSTASQEAILSGNELNLFDFVNHIIEDEEGIVYVIVLDKDNKVLAHSNSELVGKLLDNSITQQISESKEKQIISTSFNGEEIYNFYSPMVIQEKLLGRVHIGLSQKSIKDAIRTAQLKIGYIAIGALLVALLATFFLVGVLVKPIQLLAAGARRVGSGDFEHEIKVDSKNEIGQLASNFNDMTRSLNKRKKDLSTLNENAKSLNSNFNLDFLLQEGVNTIKDIINPTDICILGWLNESWQLLNTNAKETISLPDTSQLKEDPYLTQITQSRATIVINKSSDRLPSGWVTECLKNCDYALLVPMLHNEELIGSILLGNPSPFAENSQEYAELLSGSIGISMMNIKLLEDTVDKTRMEQELRTAELVQATLFPKTDPQIPGISFSGFYESASETGGDWYGYIEDEANDQVFILIGDVTGHGVPAALVTAAAHSFFSTLEFLREKFESMAATIASHGTAISDSDNPLRPSNMLNLLNKIILASTDRRLVMTFFVAAYNTKTKTMTFSNAGHDFPIVIRNNKGSYKGKPECLIASGMRLGDKMDAEFEEHQVQMYPGDVVAFYTDGITECENNEGDEYGERRFIRSIKKHANNTVETIKENLVNNAYEFYGDCPRKDDFTLVVAKIDA
ncbi:MAG: SpoIIE family protein phosphatase [Fibrobacteria bacterium]|nr:SpoIIE family protein phosphatase [Fibrobacteria bacterium]